MLFFAMKETVMKETCRLWGWPKIGRAQDGTVRISLETSKVTNIQHLWQVVAWQVLNLAAGARKHRAPG